MSFRRVFQCVFPFRLISIGPGLRVLRIVFHRMPAPSSFAFSFAVLLLAPSVAGLVTSAILDRAWIPSPAHAREVEGTLAAFEPGIIGGELLDGRARGGSGRAPADHSEIPAAPGSPSVHERGLAEVRFGFYDEATGLAIEGETWTFDHGASDPAEGWYAIDTTLEPDAWRHIDTDTWNASGAAVPPPILSGTGSAWIGTTEDEADALCWTSGLGYGNGTCQRLVSPVFAYSSGGATLELRYFNDTEVDFDFTYIILRREAGDEFPLPGGELDGGVGLAPDHPASPPVGADYAATIDDVDVGAGDSFQIVFQFESDGGWSDEDGDYATEYGPFGADDVELSGPGVAPASFDFETDLQGWTPEACAIGGSYFGIGHVSQYDIPDPCGGDLGGNVMELHDESQTHPEGQREIIMSNPADVAAAQGTLGITPEETSIRGEYDVYLNLPLADGVFFRPAFAYYPFVCPSTGESMWSPPMPQNVFYWIMDELFCGRRGFDISATDVPVPDVELIRFGFELFASCDAFGIPPGDCSGMSNFSPIFDNVQIVVRETPAPIDVPEAGPVPTLASSLHGTRPNPMRNGTGVRFAIGVAGHASVCIHDASGRLVRTLVDGEVEAGSHEVAWDGRDDSGRPVAAGVYWSQLTAPDGYVGSEKLVVVK